MGRRGRYEKIFVLYDSRKEPLSRRFLSFDPVTWKYTNVYRLRQLKVWDWYYEHQIDSLLDEPIFKFNKSVELKLLTDDQVKQLTFKP